MGSVRYTEGRTGRRPEDIQSAAIFFQAFEEGGTVKFGGAEKRMLRTLNALVSKGSAITVIFLSELDRSLIERSLAQMLSPQTLSMRVLIARGQWEVLRAVLRGRFSAVLYTDSYRAMFPFLIGGVLTRSRRIMLHVTTFLAPGRFHSRSQAMLFGVVRRLSTHIDVLYPEAMERMTRDSPRADVTLTPTPTGAPMVRGAVTKERTILFLGTLSEVKGPGLLVDAVALAADDFRKHGYRVVIAGSGPLRARLESIVHQNGVDDLVELPGQVNPPDVLGLARIFTSLQAHNNYPSQSLIEAIAAGCFIIASDEGDTHLLVEDEFGILVQRDPKSIADGLLRAVRMTDEELRLAGDAASKFFDRLQENDRGVDHYLRLIGAT